MQEFCRNEPGFFNGCGQFSSCQLNSELQWVCLHQSPFEMTIGLFVAYILIPPCVGIGMLGGLGGGILKGPFLEVILNYPQKQATDIAYCLMFGGTIINTFLLMMEKHPDDETRPMINFWIAVIFNLSIPLATNLGTSLVGFLPQIYVIGFQILFLLCVAPILWKQAMEQKRLEQKAKHIENETQLLLIQSDINNENEQNMDDKMMIKFLKESQQMLPIVPILFILFSFGINQIVIQMISSSTYNSYVGIIDCSLANNLMILVLILVNIFYTIAVYYYGRRREQQQDKVNYRMEERYFTPISRFMQIYIGGFVAGFLSGLLGMGAGLIMVPVMLSSGLIARCASATSGINYFMISMNNLITLLTNDYLDWQIILLFSLLALIGGSVFTKIGYVLMNEYKVGYIVIFFVFSLDIANILSQIYYGVVTGERYGMSILTQVDREC